MQKWGKDARGKPRFRCITCGLSCIRTRIDLRQKHKQKLFIKWLLGKRSAEEIAKKYLVSRQTIHAWFAPFWQQEPEPKRVSIFDEVLLIDGKYIEKDACVLVASTTKKVVSWHFTQRETHASWRFFFDTLREFPTAIVCDGQRGMIKAIQHRFPGVVVQRCQFHVVKYCTSKLTKKPEYLAAQELRKLVLRVAKITSEQELKNWLLAYKAWWQTHKHFIKEKTYSPIEKTPTGRRKWHYTHGRLHAAHSHLKHALPNLFHCIQRPKIPNTTNFVEGAINAPMQEKIRNHRGLKLLKRRILIAHFLRSKQ